MSAEAVECASDGEKRRKLRQAIRLIEAARSGAERELVDALAQGCEPDAHIGHGETALMYAAAYGHASCVEKLLEAGACVDAANERGVTALMCAARGANPECLARLLAAGADMEARNWRGETALCKAVEALYVCSEERARQCMGLLMARGCDLDSVYVAGMGKADGVVGAEKERRALEQSVGAAFPGSPKRV
jgi:ankyrin repeat protein